MSNKRTEAGASQQGEFHHHSDPNPHSVYTAMFPWYMGASWVSKFCGEGGVDAYEGGIPAGTKLMYNKE